MMVPSRPAIFTIILAVSAVWVSGWVASGVGLRVWEEWVGFHYLLHFCFMFLFFCPAFCLAFFWYEKCFINKVCLIDQSAKAIGIPSLPSAADGWLFSSPWSGFGGSGGGVFCCLMSDSSTAPAEVS